jgi:hypothetical protein
MYVVVQLVNDHCSQAQAACKFFFGLLKHVALQLRHKRSTLMTVLRLRLTGWLWYMYMMPN